MWCDGLVHLVWLLQDSDDGACSLHLHLRYSQMISPYFNTSQPKGPLSIKSAPMIIIAHGRSKGQCAVTLLLDWGVVLTMHLLFASGTVGKVRNNNGGDTKVYLSNDGGYTWKVSQ